MAYRYASEVMVENMMAPRTRRKAIQAISSRNARPTWEDRVNQELPSPRAIASQRRRQARHGENRGKRAQLRWRMPPTRIEQMDMAAHRPS